MPSVIDGEYQDGELRGLTFIGGERNMGKTTEMVRLVTQCAGPVIFFDTVGRHVRMLRGYKVFNQPGPLKQYMAANVGRRVRVCYVPLDDKPEEHLIAVCMIVRAYGRMVLCIDEIDIFCGPEWGAKWMPPALYYLAHFGRHAGPRGNQSVSGEFGVSMVATARDPKTLSKKFRSQCAQMRLFRTTEEDDVKYFRARIGAANAVKLPTLKPYYFLLWRAGEQDAQVCGGPRRV